MANYAQRAKAILGGMLNKPVADITDDEVLRAARAITPRGTVAKFDALTSPQKVEFYVNRMYQMQAIAIAQMEAHAAARIAKETAKANVSLNFVQLPPS